MERVVNGRLTVRQGAELLGLSERQVKRLKRRMTEEGVAALAHGNRGRKPAHAIPVAVHEHVVSLVGGLLKDATCQHVSELLAERDGLKVSAPERSEDAGQGGPEKPPRSAVAPSPPTAHCRFALPPVSGT